MAQNKTKRLSARTDEDFTSEVEQYAEASPAVEGIAQLIRVALREYMDNHKLTEVK